MKKEIQFKFKYTFYQKLCQTKFVTNQNCEIENIFCFFDEKLMKKSKIPSNFHDIFPENSQQICV